MQFGAKALNHRFDEFLGFRSQHLSRNIPKNIVMGQRGQPLNPIPIDVELQTKRDVSPIEDERHSVNGLQCFNFDHGCRRSLPQFLKHEVEEFAVISHPSRSLALPQS